MSSDRTRSAGLLPGLAASLALCRGAGSAHLVGFLVGIWCSSKEYLDASSPIQAIVGFSFYLVLALLFCTVRRRNGFAAVQDLVTKTRVISRAALQSRPVLGVSEVPPTGVEATPAVGPYHVLETLETSPVASGCWAMTCACCARCGSAPCRPARRPCRHLAQHRPSGPVALAHGPSFDGGKLGCVRSLQRQPLLSLVQTRQPWSQVRFWLYDLAQELSAANKDGTLPPALALDRVWITGDGRAKLLDFPAPGPEQTLARSDSPQS